MIHCPTCSASLRFDVSKQAMVCDHCDNAFAVEDIKDSTSADAKGHDNFEAYVFVCPDCGAELVVTDRNDAVGFCPYCGGASMLFDRIREDWVPDEIVPFKVTKEAATEAYVDHVRKYPFVSKKYRKPELVETFRGIYMPFWKYKGHQRNTRSKTEHDIEGIAGDASSAFDDRTAAHLGSFDEKNAKDFHPGYVSGFYAEIGDLDEETSKKYVSKGLGTHTVINVDSMSNMLAPVWFMGYRDKEHVTYGAVNGSTGRVAADLPLSPAKILAFAAMLSIVIFALIAFVMSGLPSIKATGVLAITSVISFISTCFLFQSLQDTLKQALDLGEARKSHEHYASVGVALLMSVLAVFGIICIVTDGSYAATTKGLGFFISFGTFILFMSWARKLVREEKEDALDIQTTTTTSQLENGIIDIYMKIRIPLLIFTVAILIICLLASILGLLDVPNKYLSYAMCGGCAVLTLLYSLALITFQVKVARRKPPQMKKEGAFYDNH